MRQSDNMETPISATDNCLTALSIVIDDFDSAKVITKEQESTATEMPQLNQSGGIGPKGYTRQASDASIKKILDEAEQRKNDFWKLLDEHNQVIENLKRIEQLENVQPASQIAS